MTKILFHARLRHGLSGIGLALILTGCPLVPETPPAVPTLTGTWRCVDELSLHFDEGQRYLMRNPSGQRNGTFRITSKPKNLHEIEWLQDRAITAPPPEFPVKFRHFPKTQRSPETLFFYWADESEPIVCTR